MYLAALASPSCIRSLTELFERFSPATGMLASNGASNFRSQLTSLIYKLVIAKARSAPLMMVVSIEHGEKQYSFQLKQLSQEPANNV